MIHILSENWQTFLTGFENTILCSVIALFFSLIIGSIFAILQTVPSKLVRTIANIYIEIFRNKINFRELSECVCNIEKHSVRD